MGHLALGMGWGGPPPPWRPPWLPRPVSWVHKISAELSSFCYQASPCCLFPSALLQGPFKPALETVTSPLWLYITGILYLCFLLAPFVTQVHKHDTLGDNPWARIQEVRVVCVCVCVRLKEHKDMLEVPTAERWCPGSQSTILLQPRKRFFLIGDLLLGVLSAPFDS